MRTLITTLIVAVALTSTAAAASRKIFEVTFNEVSTNVLVCSVAFFGQPPPPATVDKIVRTALESAVLVDSSRDILAKAFVGNDAMKSTQYSGELVYKLADKRIMTIDEYRGTKRSGQDTGAYYLETTEDKTAQGIKPERRWLSLSLVFPQAPPIQQAYDAAVAEAEKAAQKGLDVNVFVKVGDKATRTSWRQLQDPTGGYVYVDYQASTKTIHNRTKVLKKLP